MNSRVIREVSLVEVLQETSITWAHGNTFYINDTVYVVMKKVGTVTKISISRYLLHGNRHSEMACTIACAHRNYIGKLLYTVGMMVPKYECEPQKESWMSKLDQICLGCCDQIGPSPLANSIVQEPPVETGNNLQYPPHLGFFLLNYGWYTKYNIERRSNLFYS